MLTNGFAFIAIAALLAGAALQLVLALAGFRARRQERAQSAIIDQLQNEILNLQRDLVDIRRQVQFTSQAEIAPLPSAAAVVRREPMSPAYELASKLARKGANTDELMETCGLSRGEVDLITMLNRAGQAAARTGAGT